MRTVLTGYQRTHTGWLGSAPEGPAFNRLFPALWCLRGRSHPAEPLTHRGLPVWLQIQCEAVCETGFDEPEPEALWKLDAIKMREMELGRCKQVGETPQQSFRTSGVPQGCLTSPPIAYVQTDRVRSEHHTHRVRAGLHRRREAWAQTPGCLPD